MYAIIRGRGNNSCWNPFTVGSHWGRYKADGMFGIARTLTKMEREMNRVYSLCYIHQDKKG